MSKKLVPHPESSQRSPGKTRFSKEPATGSLFRGILYGHVELDFDSHSSDYGEMVVYSGSSSSGDLDPARERSYSIARSLGFPADSRLVSKVKAKELGMLPPPLAVKVADECMDTFGWPEVERDLLKASRRNFGCYQCASDSGTFGFA